MVTLPVTTTRVTRSAIEAHNASRVSLARDVGIVKGESLHHGPFASASKQTLIVAAALADAYSADGMTGAIEVAVKRMAVVADGCEVAFAAGQAFAIVCDVVRQAKCQSSAVVGSDFIVACAVRTGAIHINGEVVEVISVFYLIGSERSVVGNAANVCFVSPCLGCCHQQQGECHEYLLHKI